MGMFKNLVNHVTTLMGFDNKKGGRGPRSLAERKPTKPKFSVGRNTKKARAKMAKCSRKANRRVTAHGRKK